MAEPDIVPRHRSRAKRLGLTDNPHPVNEADFRARVRHGMTEPSKTRHIAVHLHIFKNAGTSLDRILAACFGGNLYSFDKRAPGATLSIGDVAEIANTRPAMRCFASHQVRLPLPVSDSYIMHPIFFLRDPIQRVQSCFHFERDVQKVFPETVTMEEYVRRGLTNPRINAIIGLQTSILCDNRLISPERLKTDLTREAIATAIGALHATPAFGLVDHFVASMACISKSLMRYFPELANAATQGNIRENETSKAGTKSSEKVRYVKENLTASTFTRLYDETAPDRMLYEEGRRLFLSRFGAHALESAAKPS